MNCTAAQVATLRRMHAGGCTPLTLDRPPARGLDTADPALSPCGSYWAVAQTHPQAERWADANLRRQGYDTFLPLARVWRRDRATPALRHLVTVPLFTSYIFVLISGHWTPIQHTRGVRRLLLNGTGKPGIVARAAVEALQATNAIRATQPPDDGQMAPSTPCSPAAGPFQGLEAVVTQIHGDSAQIALMMLGQIRSLTLPIASLVPRE